MKSFAHAKSLPELYEEFKTKEGGLSLLESQKRLEEFGKNEFQSSKHRFRKIKIFLEQWKSPLLYVLLLAGIVSGYLGEIIDMVVIISTAVLNASIGYFQESKAGKALRALRNLAEYESIVIRGGQKILINSKELVPGDVYMISAGDHIAADGRIIKSNNLYVNEASLTGESQPVLKIDTVNSEEMQIAEQNNMVFKGTVAVMGNALVLVTATGKNTEIGALAALVTDTPDEQTPLQKELAVLAKQQTFIILLLSIIIFISGITFLIGNSSLVEIFQLSVAIGVAAIPEGMVVSLTITLAIAMAAIVKKKALVRKLLAAETLGSVDVICTDKTGTITEGTMVITDIILLKGHFFDSQIAQLSHNKKGDKDVHTLMRIGILANEAQELKGRIVGDTTDIAFLDWGKTWGITKKSLLNVYDEISVIPFDSKNKYVGSIHSLDHTLLLSIKGAPESLLPKLKYYEENGSIKTLNSEQKIYLDNKVKELAKQGKRVIAVAYKEAAFHQKANKEMKINNLVFTGLVALSDPLRPNIKKIIAAAEHAGIRTIMLTGDHKETAVYIAKSLDLPAEKGQVVDGSKVATMSDEALGIALRKANVFSRLDPEQKIRIVKELQAMGHVVAMTGDGVNDAPALKAADIGIAMAAGTDVAKETADVVLLNNSFSTIVSAVETGRGIYQNIQKIVLYLLANSFTIVVVILGGMVGGYPLAVLPVQILWVNLIQDTIPTMSLAFDNGDRENMLEPPRKKGSTLLSSEMKWMIVLKSIFSNIALFGIFVYVWNITADIDLTRTVVFAALATDAFFYIFSVRSLHRYVWQINILKNKYLIGASVFNWIMLIGAVYLPFLQKILQTKALSWQYWLVLIAFGILNMLIMELVKAFFIYRSKSKV